jgi:hypothetical protein
MPMHTVNATLKKRACALNVCEGPYHGPKDGLLRQAMVCCGMLFGPPQQPKRL